MKSKDILVTGSTGYIGGRLVPRLLDAGYRVRALGRSASKLKCRPWASHPNATIVVGNVLDRDSLRDAAAGCGAVYYLVHSMVRGTRDFSATDRLAAKNMVAAAKAGGVERMIYLGGLGDEQAGLSPHLRSRLEVAHILQSGGVPTTFLRAAVVLGSGGASFEIMRYLVDRLPVMITPKWLDTPFQPIAVRNVLRYLEGCLEHPETAGQTYDVGGPEILTYRQLIEIYTEEAGLRKRVIIPVPLFSIRLSSYWIHLVTPVHASLARPLAESLRNRMVCGESRIRSIIPQELLTPRQALRVALDRIRQDQVETCWMDAGRLTSPEWVQCGDAPYAGGAVLRCAYRMRLKATPEEVWSEISRLGGDTGWHYGNRLYTLGRWMDILMGGQGRGRVRRHSKALFTGDVMDFWRVLEMDPPHRLLLYGEMNTPGESVLEFRITLLPDGEIELKQIGRFLPKGLAGLAYWFSLYHIHQRMFRGTLRGIGSRIGRPVISGPEPFNPVAEYSCRIPTPAETGNDRTR